MMIDRAPARDSGDTGIRPEAPRPRIAFLDSARALMLLIGIPFHVSEIYRWSGGALVESPDRSFAVTLLGGAVHVFRMPAFFVLAGFFASMMLSRRTARDWLVDRGLRLGVPLAFTTLAFGWLEVAIARAYREGIGLSEAIALTWQTTPLGWTHHRWFLFVLLLFCVTAVAVRRHVPEGGVAARRAARGLARSALGDRGPWPVVVLLVVLPFGIAATGVLSGSDGLGIGLGGAPPYENFYLHHAFFFGYGYALHHLDGDVGRLVAFDPAERLPAILSIGLYALTYERFHTGAGVPAGTALEVAIEVSRTAVSLLAGFYATKLFFLGAKRYLDVGGPIVSRLVEGALCIYLVHEVFVLGLGVAFAPIPLTPLVEFAIIVALTLAASIATFELVRRSRTLSALVNGRWAPRRPRAAP